MPQFKLPFHGNPDSGYAWIITISIAFINGITFGVFRSYGVIFVEILEYYSLSRQTASWPFSLCMTITHLSGPIAGALTSHFTIRSIVFTGSLIAAFGIMLCFQAESISEIIVYIGVIQGFGVGLSFMQTPIIISQYFDRFRATAIGISYAGGTLGSLIFPPIIKYLINSYGLHGAFLLIGGIMLHALPFALLLRPPIPKPKQPQTQSQLLKKDQDKAPHMNGTLKSNQSSQKWTGNKRIRKLSLKCTCSRAQLEIIKREQRAGIHHQDISTLIAAQNFVELELEPFIELKDHECEPKCLCMKKQTAYEEEFIEPFLNIEKVVNNLEKSSENYLISLLKNHIASIIVVLKNPLFVILSATHVSFQWGWMTHMMVIVDHALDIGIDESQAVTLLSAFAFADLFGRLSSGWVADNKWLKKRNIVSCCILLIGILLWLTPACKTFPTLLASTISLGFVSGAIIVLFSVLNMEYVGIDKLPIALGTSAFAVGVTTSVRPLVVGYFRDNVGSYDGLFKFVGIIGFMAALLWVSEPFAQIWMERQNAKNEIFRVRLV